MILLGPLRQQMMPVRFDGRTARLSQLMNEGRTMQANAEYSTF
jgi:hypothetical protein